MSESLQQVPEHERPALPSRAEDHPNVPKPPHADHSKETSVPNVKVEHDKKVPDAVIEQGKQP